MTGYPASHAGYDNTRRATGGAPVLGRIQRQDVSGPSTFAVQRHRVLLLVAGAILAGLPLPAAAAPLDPSRIDAQAAWLVHVDLDAIRGSRSVDRWTKRWLQSSAVRKKIEQLERLIGLDPTTDLHNVTLYGTQLVPNRGVLIAEGDVDTKRLHAFLENQPDYATNRRDGRTVMSWTNRRGGQQHTVYAVAHAPTVMLFSRDVDDLAEALDVLQGKRESMAVAASALPEIQPGTMLTIRVRELGETRLGLKSPILKLSETVSLVLGTHEGRAFIQARLEARSEEDVDEFRDVAEGLLALGRLLRADDPDVLRLLKNVEIHADGAAVEMRWSGQVDDVAKVIMKMQVRRAKARAAAMREDKN